MKRILFKLIAASVTNPGSGGAAAAAVTGLPALVVEHTETRPAICAWWGHNVGTGFHQLSPESGHDQTRGMRRGILAGESRMLLRKGQLKPVLTQEILTYTIAGSGAAVEYGCMLMAYPDHRAGTDAYIGVSELEARREAGKETSIYATIDSLAEGFSGRETVKAETNLLKANREYAVCGMTTTVDRAALTLESPDLGNSVIGMPGDATDPERASEWFVQLSRDTGLPTIPVIQTANFDNTYIGCVGRTADSDAVITIYLELLKQR